MLKDKLFFYRFHKSLNYFFPILNLISYFKQKKIFLNKNKIDFDIDGITTSNLLF